MKMDLSSNQYRSKSISNDYAKWVDDLVKSFSDQERVEWQPVENYLLWNALFVTFTFDKRKIARRQSNLDASPDSQFILDASNVGSDNRQGLSPEFFNVDRLYKKVCRTLLGCNYSRRRHVQPLMIAAADVNGTRYWKTAGENENLHVHSLWVFRRGQIAAARSKLEEARDSDRQHEFDFDAIDIRDVDCYDPERSSARLSSYLTKFIGFNAMAANGVFDLLVYPLDPR